MGHSDFPGNDIFDYTLEDHEPDTEPFFHPENHFQDPIEALNDVKGAINKCSKSDFERAMHRLQDNWTHYAKGYRNTWLHGWHPKHWIYGHGTTYISFGFVPDPDNDNEAWQYAAKATQSMLSSWNENCCRRKDGTWVTKSTECCNK